MPATTPSQINTTDKPLTTLTKKYIEKTIIHNWKEEEKSLQALKNNKEAVVHACNSSTLRGLNGQITRSGDQDHLGQHGETPSLLKI